MARAAELTMANKQSNKQSNKKLNPEDYLFSQKKQKSLKDFKTKIEDVYVSEEDANVALKKDTELIAEAQEKLYAKQERAVLIILQGMDTSGKDGIIKHVMGSFNPQGVVVKSFKAPTHEELRHDFLWRTNIALPKRGMVGIFNRSYYEEVVVTRIHKEFLKYQGIPKVLLNDKNFWKYRMQDISKNEEYLSRQGITILKFFLHISKEEQRKRLLKRLENPNKHWKFNVGDIRERGLWGQYQKYYFDCLKATHQKNSPWYVIPADEKLNARVIISKILKSTLLEMDLKYPTIDPDLKKNLKKIKKELTR